MRRLHVRVAGIKLGVFGCKKGGTGRAAITGGGERAASDPGARRRGWSCHNKGIDLTVKSSGIKRTIAFKEVRAKGGKKKSIAQAGGGELLYGLLKAPGGGRRTRNEGETPEPLSHPCRLYPHRKKMAAWSSLARRRPEQTGSSILGVISPRRSFPIVWSGDLEYLLSLEKGVLP